MSRSVSHIAPDDSGWSSKMIWPGFFLALLVLVLPFFENFENYFFQFYTRSASAGPSSKVLMVEVSQKNGSIGSILSRLARQSPSVLVVSPKFSRKLVSHYRSIPGVRNSRILLTFPSGNMQGKGPLVKPISSEIVSSLPAKHSYNQVFGKKLPAKFQRVVFEPLPGIEKVVSSFSIGFIPRPQDHQNGKHYALSYAGEYLIPSAALEAIRLMENTPQGQIRKVGNGKLLVGNYMVPLEEQGSFRFVHTSNKSGYSGEAILNGELSDLVKGKVVLLQDKNENAGMEFLASAISALLNRSALYQPPWAKWAMLLGTLGVCFLLMSLHFAYRESYIPALVGFSLAFMIPAISWILVLSRDIWVSPDKPMLSCVLFSVAIFVTAWGRKKEEETLYFDDPPKPSPPKAAPSESSEKKQIKTNEANGSKPVPVKTHPAAKSIRLDRYKILKPLASGSSGKVYLAKDEKLGRNVAIKVLTESAINSFHRAGERFFLEAKAAGALHHPHINLILDFGTENGISYIVLEYLDGITLSKWMRNNPLPSVHSLFPWIDQICDALDYAHGHQIIHRDLKPANLMVVEKGKSLKLMDFGIAKMEDVMLTRTGMTVGTPSYMSPEQLMGEGTGPASDQYGFAVVIYQMLSHKLPVSGDKIPDLCRKILKNEITDLHKVVPAISLDFSRALRKAMSRQPEHRYPNCATMAKFLKDSVSQKA